MTKEKKTLQETVSFTIPDGHVHVKFEDTPPVPFQARYHKYKCDGQEYKIPDHSFSRFPHETVFELLFQGKTSDMRLSYIKQLNEPSDYLTPDLIEETETDIKVTELKTCYFTDMIQSKITEIRDMYDAEVKKRAELCFKTHSIRHVVVSRDSLITNYPGLPESEAIDLYKWCSDIKSLATQAGWTYEKNSDFGEDQKQLMSNLKMLKLPDESDLPHISRSQVSDWKGRSSKKVKSIARAEFLSASSESHKEIIAAMRASRDPSALKDYDEKGATKIKNYWKLHDSHHNSNRTDNKACVQMPLFVGRLENPEKPTPDRLVQLSKLHILPNRAHSRLWIQSIEWAMNNVDESFIDLPPANPLESSTRDKAFMKHRRRKHFRVKPKMREDDKVKLATVGIESRKYRDDTIVQSVINEKSKGFTSTAPVDDIDKFIRKYKLRVLNEDFSSLFSDVSELHSRAQEVMNQSTSYNKFSNDSTAFVEEFNRTDIGVALELMENIVQEVNISRQQFCNAGEFILKSLPQFKVFLLIKSTNPTSQIFFSVLTAKKDLIQKFDLPFKAMHDFGDVYISEFVSLNQHSCTHFLYMREKALSLLAMWMSLHSTYITTNLDEIPEDCMQHFNASLLFWMEGKEQTSKEVQQVRYAYMECAMDNFINHNPLKIVDKWEGFSRSRLCIWMRKRVMNCLLNMKPYQRYTSEEDFDIAEFDKTLDKDCNLISWVTGKPVGKFEIALNLSYFGVLHNKEDSKEMHGFLKIFQKVISEELKMRDAETDNMGKTSKSRKDLKSHEFNSDVVCAIGDKLSEKLEELHPDKDGWILQKCTERLLQRDVEKLATMKKSAAGELWREEHIRDSKENQRKTCLEASVNLMSSGYDYKVMKQVGKMALEIKEEYGGIVSNLFKKLQIGGVREIFVLEFRCRIVVHFVETICRTICEEMDNEMLTKGDKKLSRTDVHFSNVLGRLKPSRVSATVINSDDATTWAQRFVMPVFGCFLSRLLPDEFVEPVMFVLNMVTDKKLELPHQLLDLYDKNPDVSGFDEGMEELKAQYMGLSTHSDLLNPRSRMLKNKSNMMQGILHYTSSLLHSGFLYLWEDFTKDAFSLQLRNMYSVGRSEFDLISTTKVSSDDSSCILSIVCEKEPRESSEKQAAQLTERNLRMMMSVFTEAKAKLYPLFASKQSVEKSSTSGHSNIEEFNSLWYYKNTLLTPAIKFVAACVKTHPNSKLDDRYHTYANLRNNLFEHSGSIMLCSVCEYGQMSAHYKTLGLRTNKLWNEYKNMLLENPHPSVGFFLLEHPLCCGMFGYDMAVYMACSNRRFRNIHLGLYRDENFEFTENGRPTVRTYISFGQSTKYYEFKKKLGVNDSELKSYIEQNVINMYRESSTTYDSLMKLKIQASNPALSESMAFQTDSKLHAASAYILQDSVILQSKGMMGANHSHQTFFDISKNFNSTDLTEYKWLFPFGGFYESVLGVLDNYKTSSLGAYVNRRSVSSKLDIATNSMIQSVTLFQVVQRKWFNIPDVRGTRFSHELVFEHYCSKFSWLKSSADKTLAESPFEDHLSLRNFIISISSKKKTVRTYAPSNIVSSPIEIVRSMIENCQWKGQKLNYVSVRKVTDARAAMNILTERVWRCLRAPIVKDKASLIEDILSRNIDPFASAELTKDMYELSQSQIALCILIKFSKLRQESDALKSVIPALIERFRLGVIGHFTQRQVLKDGNYRGAAIYSGVMEGGRIDIHAQDSIITHIICKSEVELKHMSHTLLDFARDVGWQFLNKAGAMGQKYWDFNTRRMISTKHSKSVSVVFKEMKSLPTMKGSNMKIEVTDYNTIRLVNVESNRKYTILSYRIRTRDLGENDTHEPDGTSDKNHVSTWLRSDKMPVLNIEEEILTNAEYEAWACDTIRRRLMGLNKLPNLDSLFEQSPDEALITDDNDSDTSEFMRMAAQEVMTLEDLELFSNLFNTDESSSEDNSKSEDNDIERVRLEEFDSTVNKDMSWLDYVKMPFKPGITVDSAVTNKYFDPFIEVYTDVFGKLFLNFFVKKPDSLCQLIRSKRKRTAENAEMFYAGMFDEII